MSTPEADPHLLRLGLSADFTAEELRQAYAERAAELPAGSAELEALRESHNVLNVRLRRRLPAGEAVPPPPGHQPAPKYVAPKYESYDPAAYDNLWITALGPVDRKSVV